MSLLFAAWLMAWSIFLLRCYWGVRFLPTTDSLTAAAAPSASVSIVIAVKDGADELEASLARLTRMRYPGLEIVVVDDRSTDRTPAVLAAYPAVKFLRVEQLPEGWLGKVHAMAQGTALATGEYLLFMDADVVITPEALVQSTAIATAQQLDHLAVLPRVAGEGFFLQLLVVTSEILFTLSARPWLSIAKRPVASVKGVGSHNLVRREFLAATEGFSWLRMDVADDVALAQLVAARGGRSLFAKTAPTSPAIRCAWYPDFWSMVRGLEKNTVGGFTNYQRWRMVAVPLVALAPLGVPLMAILRGEGYWALPCLAAALLFAGGTACRLARPWWLVAAFPLGIAILAAVLLRASFYCLRNGGISWNGTFYSLKELRDGTRIRLGL